MNRRARGSSLHGHSLEVKTMDLRLVERLENVLSKAKGWLPERELDGMLTLVRAGELVSLWTTSAPNSKSTALRHPAVSPRNSEPQRRRWACKARAG